MFRNKFINIILLLSLLAIAIFPLYTFQFVYPSVDSLLTKDSEREAVNITSHISSTCFRDAAGITRETIRPDFLNIANELRRDFGFVKLKIFTLRGEVIFSTDKEDIGNINSEGYFRNVLSSGKPFSKVVRRSTKSLENETMTKDVLETYVPMLINGQPIGAVEVYLDITTERQQFHNLIRRTVGAFFLIGVCLTLAVAVVWRRAMISEAARIRAEEERSRLLKELRDALEQVKTLSGFLPICASCKKIRDDNGYWQQIEAYISAHSEAEFSHGLCPDCAKRLYPDFYKDGQ